MLYLLFALTFLAGILFYGMSPREDKLNLDTNQAEGMVVSFLNQHQAAKDYVYAWMGVGPENESDSNIKQTADGYYLKAENDGVVFNFINRSTPLMTFDVCMDNLHNLNQGKPGLDNDLNQACFVSQVVCANNSGDKIECSQNTVKERYVVTYGGWDKCSGANCTRPNWWPAESIRVRRFERWRKAMANRTRGSISCGTLYKNDVNGWCIDNGEILYKNENDQNSKCVNPVPTAVIASLPYNDNFKDDLLLCYSKAKQGLGSYVSGASHFYDGFNNIALGRHTNDSNSQWTNLQGGGNNISPVNWHSKQNQPYLFLNASKLYTEIPLGQTFTLTVLVDTPTGQNTAVLLGARSSGGADTDIFKKDQDSGHDAFQVRRNDGTIEGESACNVKRGGNGNDKAITTKRIISWTFVVEPCDANTCITVYENAAKHELVSGNGLSGTIPSVNGQTLFLSTNSELKIYGIRYYAGSALTHEQIKQNFKVDQRRFGIADYSNGEMVSCTVEENSPCTCQPINNNAGGE